MPEFMLLIICLCFSVSVTAETVYKTTNPDGSVEFTDRKSNESEEIKINKPSVYTAPRLPAATLPQKKLSPTFNYALKIIQPAEDETITNTTEVVVSVLLEPAFKKGYAHQVRYQLGSQTLLSKETKVTFKNVVRGTHDLKVSVVNAEGELVSPITSVKFHLKRFFKKTPPPITPPPPA